MRLYLVLVPLLGSCVLFSGGGMPLASCEDVDGSESDPDSACYTECIFIDPDGDGNLVAVAGYCLDTGEAG